MTAQSGGTQLPTAAIDTLTTAIYGLQRQMGQVATRLSAIEGHAPTSSGETPLYGMPGYGGVTAAPPAHSTVVHATALPDSDHPDSVSSLAVALATHGGLSIGRFGRF